MVCRLTTRVCREKKRNKLSLHVSLSLASSLSLCCGLLSCLFLLQRGEVVKVSAAPAGTASIGTSSRKCCLLPKANQPAQHVWKELTTLRPCLGVEGRPCKQHNCSHCSLCLLPQRIAYLCMCIQYVYICLYACVSVHYILLVYLLYVRTCVCLSGCWSRSDCAYLTKFEWGHSFTYVSKLYENICLSFITTDSKVIILRLAARLYIMTYIV